MGNITDQHLSPHQRKKYTPNPKNLGISALFSAGVGAAFKGHWLK
jgi:hypothetical protein